MIKFASCVALAATLTVSSVVAVLGQSAPSITLPDGVQWTAGTGPETGTQVAVLEGNPEKAGPYTVRLKIPAGAKFMPHSHQDVEHVTVLSGTLLVGLGDTFDQSKMKALPAGSFVVVPSGVHHYAMAQSDTVLQIHGTGPSSFDMVGASK